MALSRLALAVVAAMFANAAEAQRSPMPEHIAQALLELGRVIDPPRTFALYAPQQEKEPYQGVKVERDVKYGPADRNLLDIFMPDTAPSPRPVLIYVHAGAYVGGNKRTTPTSPFYDNIMLWAVRNGFVGVNVAYRLAPQAPWPAGAEDLATAVQWIADKISERGGNGARIFLMGHSAGAVHVATYVSHPELHRIKGGGLAGAIMISGIYDLTAMPLADTQRAYFGDDAARYAERSPSRGLATTDIPLMMVAAELDPEGFVVQLDIGKRATCKRASGCARAILLPQHSHMSEVYSINTADTRLTDQILDFVKTGK
ncbi:MULTISPECIES: alpha/beta hydrolase [unclassified Bradyrhizobium]|uniref:alpha/beta hydrolase n=1 Tax=unclassified Bradyrhizobium TaxID=2631580 RepID=UPI002FEF4258